MSATRLSGRLRRKLRGRKNLHGSKERPRLTVFRSDRHIYAQVVEDTAGHTLAAASTLSKALQGSLDKTGTIEAAKAVGGLIAERALEKGVSKVVFDRSGFLYHGRIKALADAAREKGLKF